MAKAIQGEEGGAYRRKDTSTSFQRLVREVEGSMTDKRTFHFALEDLNLLCEWEECSRTDNDIGCFISHITKEHLTRLSEDDMHCHWKDCEGFTENLPELRRHILLHAFHTKIKCYGKNLQERKELPNCTLSIHSRNIIPELPEALLCSWEDCFEVFECPEYFYRHVEYHAGGETKKSTISCLWHGCSRKFGDHHKLREHLRSHTQEKLVACPTCGGMFASRTKFLDHIQRQLPVEDQDPDSLLICEYCSRKMSSERLLRDHMRHHVNHYKCMFCDMTCPTPSALQLHIAYRHSDNKPHACMYCDHKCKSENDLRRHLETHSAIPSYKCPVEGCSYTTRSQACYNAHYRKKHEGKASAKYSCHLCEKLCTRGNYLTKHLINHHKFKWPSGHCRFRYRLHEDGLYRLQTVRYESLELSEAMICDENVDDPSILIADASESIGAESSPYCVDQSQISDTNIITNSESSIPTDSILCMEYGDKIQLSSSLAEDNTASPLTGESDVENSDQQPVLINIVDAEESTSESGSSVLLIKTSQPCASDQKRSVQIITEDASGRIMLETAEVVALYDYSCKS